MYAEALFFTAQMHELENTPLFLSVIRPRRKLICDVQIVWYCASGFLSLSVDMHSWCVPICFSVVQDTSGTSVYIYTVLMYDPQKSVEVC
jgi:hypothetical protein